MFALFVALLASVLLVHPISSVVNAEALSYTIHSSVIFARTGERTPQFLGSIPTTLTSLGAQQSYRQGAFFRDRYLAWYSNSNQGNALLAGLSVYTVKAQQLSALALNRQYIVASAQAFLQGLYPPHSLNASAAPSLDPTSVLANSSYIEFPMQGYQYVRLQTAGGSDPNFVGLGGSLNCPNHVVANAQYYNTPEFKTTSDDSKSLYATIGARFLGNVLQPVEWKYDNAYAIWDYLNYQNQHNASVASVLSSPDFRDRSTNVTYFTRLQWLADHQQYAFDGNLTAVNPNYSGSRSAKRGSISTIAGATLAAKILGQFATNILGQGETYKLNILFGDFEPFLSFFALASLPERNNNFRGLPAFGSVMVFELFSYTNSSQPSSGGFPDPANLWVRFSFRNGTADDAPLQAYPLFNRGPSETDMSWYDFVAAMEGIMVADIGEWCLQCGAANLFCAAWNSSLVADAAAAAGSSAGSRNRKHGMAPAVAGVVGAIVTLAVAGIAFAAAMLWGGVRLRRLSRTPPSPSPRSSPLGGFKGAQKLASDRDLTVLKGEGGGGASFERKDRHAGPVPDARERVGSWELKDTEAGRFGALRVDGGPPSLHKAGSFGRRPSFEDDRLEGAEPVRAVDRV
ncbi:hypothetical protein LTR28_008919 [Elasticomyces elasticus]|nr:hypothetical protein LTR28_008919 [Elasticomyces elasticus]